MLKSTPNNRSVYLLYKNNIIMYSYTKYISILQYFYMFNDIVVQQMFSFIKYFITKFSFIGKTYRMTKRKKHIKLFFNRSHITFLFFKNFFKIKKLKKNKIKLLFLLNYDYYYFKKAIKEVRNINIFTKRGIKIYNLIRFSKKGKISTYR